MIPVLAAAAALPLWTSWKYERTIAKSPRGTVAIVVPPSLYANTQRSLGDVRIVGESGAQPFAIVTPPPPDNTTWVDATLTDSGYVPHRYSQVIADLGAGISAYDDIEIATTASSFATTATIEASEDRREWRIVRTGAPIYDYASDGLATNLRVPIPATTARYIRIRVARDDFPIDGVRAAQSSGQPRELNRYTTTLRDTANATGNDSVYDLDGIRDVPIERVEVDSTTTRYARSAELQSNDGAGWSAVSQTQLFRLGDKRERSFDFPETQATQWRLVVHNGDDAALQHIVVRAFGAPRRIVFDAHGADDTLLYGNPNAEPPSYDFAQTHPGAFASTPTVALGAPQLNPAFIPAGDTRPWSERNRWVVWLALAAAVLVVGAIAIRTLRSDASAS